MVLIQGAINLGASGGVMNVLHVHRESEKRPAYGEYENKATVWR